jgi:hypothetical protein
MRSMFRFSTLSLRKWYLISICLVLEWMWHPRFSLGYLMLMTESIKSITWTWVKLG